MLLDGKRILVTGVLNDASIAFPSRELAQEQGAEVVLTSFGRVDEPHAAHRPPAPDRARGRRARRDQPGDLDALADAVGGQLDGVLHAIAFAPESCLGGGFLDAPWDDVAVAFQVSAYSLEGARRRVRCRSWTTGGSIVGLDFDNQRQAWPVYDWMGVAKSAFESTARYLARDLGPHGIRVNLVSAGPIRTIAARSIPGFEQFEEVWSSAHRSAGTSRIAEPVAQACVALLSDWFPATTGEMLHVDGGFHAVGA